MSTIRLATVRLAHITGVILDTDGMGRCTRRLSRLGHWPWHGRRRRVPRYGRALRHGAPGCIVAAPAGDGRPRRLRGAQWRRRDLASVGAWTGRRREWRRAARRRASGRIRVTGCCRRCSCSHYSRFDGVARSVSWCCAHACRGDRPMRRRRIGGDDPTSRPTRAARRGRSRTGMGTSRVPRSNGWRCRVPTRLTTEVTRSPGREITTRRSPHTRSPASHPGMDDAIANRKAVEAAKRRQATAGKPASHDDRAEAARANQIQPQSAGTTPARPRRFRQRQWPAAGATIAAG